LFDPLNPEFSPGNRIIDIFASCFFFHTFSKCNDKDLNKHIQQLDDLAIKASGIPSIAFVVSDASVKNNIVTSILYIHIHNKPITKILHHAVNVTSTEAELFVIRCSINQATCHNEISKIIVVTNSIHVARKIFDSLLHPFQKQSAAVLKKLQMFFSLSIRRIQSSFGNALVVVIGPFTKQSMLNSNCFTQLHCSQANYPGTSAKSKNAMTLLIGGR